MRGPRSPGYRVTALKQRELITDPVNPMGGFHHLTSGDVYLPLKAGFGVLRLIIGGVAIMLYLHI
jgi:hypothetical protein